MASALRSVVSGRRYRLKDSNLGIDLDLCYVCKEVLAMSVPSSSVVESAFRNNIDDVASFLKHYHENHFLIVNTAMEKSYDYQKFNSQVIQYGWKDHHSPPLDLLFHACHALANWIRADEDNVVVIHCKAGKGRTGVLTSCLLLYCSAFSEAPAALEYFALRRSSGKAEKGGVTIPSQRRYVHYFHRVLNGFRPVHRRLRLVSVSLSCMPNFDGRGSATPTIKIMSVQKEGHKLIKEVKNAFYLKPANDSDEADSLAAGSSSSSSSLLSSSGALRLSMQLASSPPLPVSLTSNFSSSSAASPAAPPSALSAPAFTPAAVTSASSASSACYVRLDVVLSGDVLLKFKHTSQRLKTSTKMFHFAFHTAFVDSSLVLVLSKKDLDDGYKDKRVPEDFQVELKFESVHSSSGYGGADSDADSDDATLAAEDEEVWRAIIDKRSSAPSLRLLPAQEQHSRKKSSAVEVSSVGSNMSINNAMALTVNLPTSTESSLKTDFTTMKLSKASNADSKFVAALAATSSSAMSAGRSLPAQTSPKIKGFLLGNEVVRPMSMQLLTPSSLFNSTEEALRYMSSAAQSPPKLPPKKVHGKNLTANGSKARRPSQSVEFPKSTPTSLLTISLARQKEINNTSAQTLPNASPSAASIMSALPTHHHAHAQNACMHDADDTDDDDPPPPPPLCEDDGHADAIANRSHIQPYANVEEPPPPPPPE